MKNLLILSGVIALAAGYTFYADYAAKPVQEKAQSPLQKEEHIAQAPDFSFHDLSGKTYNLYDFKGKAVVLNFWAPWCAPCTEELPQMVTLASGLKKDAVFIFLSVDEDALKIRQFLKKHFPSGVPGNVIVGTDRDMQISQKLFQTYALPETYLISPDSGIAQKIIGASVKWDSADMRRKITGLQKTP